MLLVQALVAAGKAWVERAGGRLNAAAVKLDSGTYDSQLLFRDVFKSVVTDPFQWYLDFNRETEPSRILIDARSNPSPSSDPIPVRDPTKTVMTSMARIDGPEVMAVTTNVLVDKPPTPPTTAFPAGTVVVRLQNVNTAGFPPGHYVGYLIDDNVPVAFVIALR